MTLNNIEVTEHFLKRARLRNIPIELIEDCLRHGRKKKTNRNLLVDNKLIVCCLSLIDKAALTVIYSKCTKLKFERDARRYNTTREFIAGKYFESLGYKN